MNTIDPFTSYDRYDRYETPSPAPQRQHRPLHRAGASISSDQGSRSDRSTPLSSQRGLRRTPRFIGTPSPQPKTSPKRAVHLEAVSVGISPPGLFATANRSDEDPPLQARQERPHPPVRQLSQDLLTDPLEEASATVPSSLVPPRTSSRRTKSSSTHPFVHISKHTHSAILWAVEEALRYPNPFTPDLIEENAAMSDLSDLRGAGGQPTVTNGFGSPTSRPTAPPMQTGSPSGIKGPKKIMEERAAREKAREAAKEERRRQERQEQERERLEQVQAETEARQLEEHQRRMADRRAAAAAGAAPPTAMPTGGDPSVPISTQPIDPTGSQRRRQQQTSTSQAPLTSRTQASVQASQRPSRTTGAQPQNPLQFSGVPGMAGSGGPPPGVGTALPGDPSGVTSQSRNTFPHAFERWEALSAHWEGLTSFWIRKLQQHAEEIDRDPLSSQLSRQVTDLSAAGANLFHAVVELQRLRASSERKFQRWFFETRAELERHEENKAALERALADERMSKAAAIKEAVDNEQNSSRTQKRINEMQKELQISKEEARRAWEELGRREQEERDRTISLQQGLPTIVGGVQVVPMTQGVPSRGTTSQDSRQTQQSEVTSPQYPQYAQPSQRNSGAGPSSSGAGYYEQPSGAGEDERAYSAEGQSEGGYSEGEYLIDAQGKFVRDARGRKIPYPGTPGDDESDSGAEEYETPSAQAGVSYPPSASQSQWSGQPDYSGSDYAAPGWETMPRHHHPTRLSDVLEEDETRSRTSAGQSQVSRR